MKCPNKSHPDWKELVNKVGVNDAYLHYVNNGQEIPNPEDVLPTIRGINTGLKVLNAIASEKGISLFNKFFKRTPEKFYSELAKDVGQLQTDLLREELTTNNITTVEDAVTHIASQMTYTIGMDTVMLPDYYGGGVSENYNSLSAEGGNNYSEHDIVIDSIVPVKTSHLDHTSPNSVGWFRIDNSTDSPSIRRIQEMQSDLFQKVKDGIYTDNVESNKFLSILGKGNTWMRVFLKSIIQDSVLKGYSKIQIPFKNTVNRIQQFNDNDSDSAIKNVVNFYSNTIPNILRKEYGKERVQNITDVNGNTWTELTLKEEDGNEFYFQDTSTASAEEVKEVNDSIRKFMTNNNISYEAVSEIVNPSTGEKLDAIAIADLMTRTIRVVEGKAKADTLPEEAGHFLVELLGENHPLYKSMFSEVTKYQIYQDVVTEYSPIYGDNDTKLRKEAMAKIIAQKLLGNEVELNEQSEARIDRWYNRVFKYLKDKIKSFLGLPEVTNALLRADPFSESARMIMREEVVESDELLSEDWYLQTQSQEDIVNRIENKYKLTKDDKGYILHTENGPKRVKNRVTDLVKSFQNRTFRKKENTATETAFAQLAAREGTKGHNDIENIIKRAVAKRDGTVAPAKVSSLPSTLYDTLEKYFNDFVASLPASSKIITEQMIYDEKFDRGGTIDVLVIDEDGTAHMYDHKFISFGKEKEIKWYKEQSINIQMNDYRRILRERYGITSFGKIRAIPIEAKYDKTKMTAIKVGSLTAEAVPGQEHLNQLPIFEEMTGDAGLDRILLGLLSDKKKIGESVAPPSSTEEERTAFNTEKAIKLAQIQKAIRDIQLRHDLTEYINIGKKLNERLDESDLSELSDAELANLLDTKLNFYGKELVETLSSSLGDNIKEFEKDLAEVAIKASQLSSKLKSEVERRVRETQPELLSPQKKIGTWNKNFRTFFNQDNPVIASFANLIQRSEDKLRREYNEINEKVVSARDALRKAGITDYKWMMKTTSTGRKRIVSKYSPSHYDSINENRSILTSSTASKAEKERARKFILERYEFNEEGYKKGLAKEIERIEKLQKKYGFPDEVKGSRILAYENRYSNNNAGLASQSNYFLKMKDNPANYSQEFKDIQSNPAKKQFYDTWMEYSMKYQEYIGQKKDMHFVWNVPLKMVQGLLQNGVGHVLNKNNWTNYFTAQAYDYYANVDPESKEIVFQVPKYYNTETVRFNEEGNPVYDTSLQSEDLGEVLLSVAGMAINHKNMLEIEQSTHFLKHIMATRESFVTDVFNNPIKDELTGEFKTQADNSDNLQTFNQYMEYYLYGRKSQSKDFKVNGLSGIALLNSASELFRSKALAANPVSILAGYVGGSFNAVMLGASKRYFGMRDFLKGQQLVAGMGKKSKAIRGFFDIEEGNAYNLRNNKASMNVLNKIINKDNLYFGQRFADWQTKQSLLFAMMQQFRVVDGKIENLKFDGSNKDAPSLYDYAEVTDTGIDFKDIPSEELDLFRNRVLKITDSVLGTGNVNDVRIANMHTMLKPLLMFRSWLPRTFEVRVGGLHKDQVLGEWEMGRYRSILNELLRGYKDGDNVIGGLVNVAKELATGFGAFGYGNNVRNTTIEHAKLLYAEAKVKDPNLTITEEEYIQLHLGNLRAGMVELYSILGMTSLIMFATPDDDEEDVGQGRRFAVALLDRFQTELLTYMNPTEFNKMIRSPLPITRLYSDITNLVNSTALEGAELIIGEDDLTTPNQTKRAWMKIVPVASGVESVYDYVFDEEDDE